MRKSILALAAFLLTACASGGGGTGMTSAPIDADVRRVSANLITAEEIAAQTFNNAWQAIISLRPTWPKIPAYVGNARIAFDRLQEIPVATVKEIRLLSREQARVRFGPDAQQTILVVTR
jgi:hypothetical protein